MDSVEPFFFPIWTLLSLCATGSCIEIEEET